MNIALIDNNKLYNKLLSILSKDSTIQWNIIRFCSFDEYRDISRSTNLDIIIIDFTQHLNIDIYSKIVEQNPNQNFLFISDSLNCSHIDCHHCIHNKRLLLPINDDELLNTIKNFNSICCPYSDILNVIDSISKEYNYHRESHSFLANNTIEKEQLLKAKKAIEENLRNLKIPYKLVKLDIVIL